MSRYDTLRCEVNKIRQSQFAATVLPSAVAATLVGIVSLQNSSAFVAFLGFVVVLVALPILLHHVWSGIIVRYAELVTEARQITDELRSLKQNVDGIYQRYPQRKKGEQFKRAYGLSGMTVADLEETLAVGMYFEEKEVFVTAFITNGIAVRVTASIGSTFRCSASDDPSRWRGHVTRLGCEEVRQYHNHPAHNNKTEPSQTDYRTCLKFRNLLQEHADKLRSFIVHWNEIREWRIIEYDESESFWLATAFDAAA
jgi:hypothetical protein